MIGIDAKIETVKALFTSKLYTTYNYDSYGRAFVNLRDGKEIPEILDSGNEYKEVLLDSAIDVLSFFVVDDTYTVQGNSDSVETRVNIYFAANLGVVYSTITERAVEYLHRDVLKILHNTPFDTVEIVQGRKAFSEFDIEIGDNMQPYYLAKFITEVRFNINC